MQLHFIHAIKGLNLLFCLSVLSPRCVWCDASGLAQGTQLQNNVDTEKPDRIRVWRSSWQKKGELKEEEQQLWQKTPAEDKKWKKRRENREGADCEWLTWTFCVQQRNLLLPVKCLLTLTSPLEKGYNLSSLSFDQQSTFLPLSSVEIWTEGDSSRRQHVPCHCHLPLHALDSAQYRGSIWRAYCLYEHWLASGIPPHTRCRLWPPWGHHSRRGLQTHFGHLRPLYKTTPHAAWNIVRTLRSSLWGNCQRVLAGYLYLPGSRDPAALCRGFHLGLHHVLPKHHEEEHLQCVWTATRDRRWDSHTTWFYVRYVFKHLI